MKTSISNNISKTCRYCFYHIRDLRCICPYISFSVYKTIATALVSSGLEYCNTLLYITANSDTANLQHVQHFFARVVTRSLRFSHPVPLRKSVHYRISLYILIDKNSIPEFDAHSDKKSQTTTINQ